MTKIQEVTNSIKFDSEKERNRGNTLICSAVIIHVVIFLR